MEHRDRAPRMFFKLFKFEVKRYFSNTALLIIACVVPILLIVTLLGSMLPVLFRGAELNDIDIALFNEDSTFETNMIIRHLAEADSVEDFIDIIEVDSLLEGEEMLEDNQVSAIIHIPKNLQENLYQGKSQTLYFYAGEGNKQIVRLIYDMLDSGLNNINQAQKSVDIVYYSMRDMGYSSADASVKYRSMAEDLFTNIISRSDIYTDYSEVSATGDYLNIEYYLISTLLLSLFFLALPICAKMSKDKKSGVMDRGGFYLNIFAYSSSKVIAGGLYLLLPAAVTSVVILAVSGAFGLFSGDVWLLSGTIILSTIYFSSIMMMVGALMPSTTSALWSGFSLALVISMISGIFIPRDLMPRGIVTIAEATGLPAIIRLYGASLFGVNSADYILDLLVVFAVAIVLYAVIYIKTRRRMGKT